MYKTIIIIPCFKVEKHILNLLKKINFDAIYKILIIDDNCPNKTGLLVRKQFKYKKVCQLFYNIIAIY